MVREQPRKAPGQQPHTAARALPAAQILIDLLPIEGNLQLLVAEAEQGQQLLSLKIASDAQHMVAARVKRPDIGARIEVPVLPPDTSVHSTDMVWK